MISNLPAGSYTVTVTDANGCTCTSSMTVTEPPALNCSVSVDNPISCTGGNDGKLTAMVSGGTPGYSFMWSNGATTAMINNLSAGTYTVTITDANGCTCTKTVVLDNPNALVCDIIINDQISCVNGNDGKLTATASGGTPGYTFMWSTGATTAMISNLPQGTYTVTVTDANNCQCVTSVTLNDPPQLNCSIAENNPISCFGGSDGSLTGFGNGGTPPYSFSWSTGAVTQTINNLSQGTYTLTVTDANGCTCVTSHTLTHPPMLTCEVDVIQDVSCFGGTDGILQVIVGGGTPGYTYLWNTGQTTQTISNLGPGTYTVTVTDANGCICISSATLTEPISVECWIGVDSITCHGANDGKMTVSPAGGTPPYSVVWSTGGTGNMITNLGPGTYSVTVTDSKGCICTKAMDMYEPPQLNCPITVNSGIDCQGNNTGQLTVNPSGGTLPYSLILWSTADMNVNTISNLSSGTYSVTVVDANMCECVSTVTINAPPGLNCSVNIDNAISCFGTNDGQLTASASGGTPAYSYQWSNGAVTQTVSNLGPGTYTVTITDVNGCSCIESTTLTEPIEVECWLEIDSITCFGANDGKLTVNTGGGTAPYTFLWNTGATTSMISNLGPGQYCVTVTDAHGCECTKCMVLDQPIEVECWITVDQQVSCQGGNNGQLTVTFSGGTPGYSVMWDNGSNTPTISNLGPGTYTVTVTDANGCVCTQSITLTDPSQMNCSITVNSNSPCGATNGQLTANVSGGTPGYSFVWSNGAVTQTVSNLMPGAYSVTITDANGCVCTSSATVNGSPSVTVSVIGEDASCGGVNNGTATAVVTSGTPPYTYAWSNGGGNVDKIQNLGPGSYCVTVTDANGCTGEDCVIIKEDDGITNCSVNILQEISCTGDMDGALSVTASGGTIPYTFLWNYNNATTSTLSNLGPGTYMVTITDANGCTCVASAVLIDPTPLWCEAEVKTMISTIGGSDGSVEVNVFGGTAPYTYLWDTGHNTKTVNNLGPGTYSVTVTDAHGCTCVSQVTLLEPAKLGNFVWFDDNENGIQDPGEAGVADITVELSGTDVMGNPVTGTTTTDSTGMYMFTVKPGDYKVTFIIPATLDFTDPNIGGDETKDSDADPTMGGMTEVVTVTGGQYYPDLDAGVVGECINIGDFMWKDLNRNGIQDPSEPFVKNHPVHLKKAGPDGQFCTADDIIVATEYTDFYGKYLFKCVMPGMTYIIQFDPNYVTADHKFTKPNMGSDDEKDSDADTVTGCTPPFTVVTGMPDDLSFDAGIYPICLNVGNGGTIGHHQTICVGFSPDTLVTITPPSGGVGPLEYLWMKSTIGGPFNPNTWTAISGATSENYAPGPLFQTTYFIRCVRRAGCDDYKESNAIAITVIPYNPNDCPPFIINLKVKPSKDHSKAILSWTESGDLGGLLYYTEHSGDGKTFRDMEEVPAIPNPGKLSHYTALDENPKVGSNYYRVRLQNIKGEVLAYSNIEKLIFSKEDIRTFVIYPNPFAETINIESGREMEDGATIEFYTATGIMVHSLEIEPGTEIDESIALGQLPRGVYVIKIHFGETKSELFKVVKIE